MRASRPSIGMRDMARFVCLFSFSLFFRFDRARDINVYRIWVVRPVIIVIALGFYISVLSAAAGFILLLYRDKIYNGNSGKQQHPSNVMYMRTVQFTPAKRVQSGSLHPPPCPVPM